MRGWERRPLAVGGADEVVLDVLDKGSSGCRQELYHSIKSALVADNQVLLQTRAVSFNQVGSCCRQSSLDAALVADKSCIIQSSRLYH